MSKMAQKRNVLMSSSVITAMLFVCLSSFREKASRSSVSIKYYPNSVKPVLPSKHITENPQIDSMSKMLGISGKTAYALLRDNKIEHFKVGRTYKIPKIHILSYLRVLSSA